MSKREKVTAVFSVKDPQDNQYQVTQTTTFETGRLIGGGEMPTGVRHEMLDGTQLEALLGDQQFIDRRGGRIFKRV